MILAVLALLAVVALMRLAWQSMEGGGVDVDPNGSDTRRSKAARMFQMETDHDLLTGPFHTILVGSAEAVRVVLSRTLTVSALSAIPSSAPSGPSPTVQKRQEAEAALRDAAEFALHPRSATDDRAIAAYTRAVDIYRSLHVENPQDTDSASDLAETLSALGNYYLQRAQPGDAVAAVRHLQESLALLKELLAAHPEHPKAPGLATITQSRLARGYSLRAVGGDIPKALRNYEESLAASRRILAADPQNAQEQHQAILTLILLGDLHLGLRESSAADAEAARRSYEEALVICQKHFAADPASKPAGGDLAAVACRLADFHRQSGKADSIPEAARYLQMAITTFTQLFAANPRDSAVAEDLVSAHYLRAQFARNNKDLALAEKEYRECHRLLQESLDQGLTFHPPTMKMAAQLRARYGREK